MKLDYYELESYESYTYSRFISTGVKGNIKKAVQFQKTRQSNLYNLAFGDVDDTTGALDDLSISNNADTEKILSTVVRALYLFLYYHPIFLYYYPGVLVYATGSTTSRTRLYQIGIAKYFKDWVLDFTILGETEEDWKDFKIGKNYLGFLAMQNLQ